MVATIIGAGEVKPAPVPHIINDEKYNVDVYLASCQGSVLDILVPTHAHIELTINCIKSLYSHTQTPFHLIILNDAPVDDYGFTESYIKKLQKEKDNITYCHSNIPFKNGNTFFNVGIKYSKTEYVATVMNSVTVEPNWELTALELLRRDKQIGIIGFKCLFPSGFIESAGIAFRGHIPTDMFRDEPGYRANEVREAEAVQWAFALHRKAALEGNLDESLFNGHVGWDDIDNCMAVKSKGWKVLYCGQGIGIHAPRSTRGSNSVDAFLRNQQNSHVFFKRWGLWNKYLEANKMNVADILKPETKDILSNAVLKVQLLQQLLQREEAQIRPLVDKALKELGVEDGKFLLEMNPQQNMWVLKPNVPAISTGAIAAPVPGGPARQALAGGPASDTEQKSIEKTTLEIKA